MFSVLESVKEILETRLRLDFESYKEYKKTKAFSYGIIEGLMYRNSNFFHEISKQLTETLQSFEPRIISISIIDIKQEPKDQLIILSISGSTKVGNFVSDIKIKMQ